MSLARRLTPRIPRSVNRRLSAAYEFIVRSLPGRRGKCQFTYHTNRWNSVLDSLPKVVKYRLYLRFPFHRVIRCDNPATSRATSGHFEGYDGLPVCSTHLRDVEASNELDRLIKTGELDSMLDDARTKREQEGPPGSQ